MGADCGHGSARRAAGCQFDVFPHLLLRHPGKLISRGGQSCRLQGKCDRLAAVGRHRPAAHHHSNSRHGISLQNHQASAADSRAEMVGSAACRLRPAAHGRQSVQRRLLRSVRQSAYLCSADAPIFSVFGCIWYDITDAAEPITPEKQAEIERWLASQPKHQPANSVTEKRSNLLIVFAESLESWVLEKKVDGKEITPCLNRLLKEKSTLYAPNVLTQVKGGRSIDAQLMICSGLLPLMSGTYSSLYYDNTFYTLQKAMRGLKHSRSYLLTIDKVSTWNQGAVARSFGTDTIISYHDFKMTEAFGTHKRIGDASFFQQCREKIERGEVWKPGESVYMQFVTYSGHAPFKLPDHLRTITFPASIPEKAADYMTTAHYTDKAIGDFVAYLKTLPQYKETIVVIVGDHEGLASYRQELVGNPACRGLVSDKQLTPFIVLNSPVGMRYDKFMGQIDIYPTLLNLMQLDAYRWHGLGQSILDPRKQGVAVGSVMNVEGTGSDKEVERLKEAHTVSDYMLRYDWLKRLD